MKILILLALLAATSCKPIKQSCQCKKETDIILNDSLTGTDKMWLIRGQRILNTHFK